MAKSKNQHVVSNKEGWGVLGQGNTRVTKLFETQRAAINHAREIAKNQGSEVVIHGEDGKIREKNSYGNDPHPPKG